MTQLHPTDSQRAAAECAAQLRQPIDSTRRAYMESKLQHIATVELAREDLTPEVRDFFTAALKIANGAEIELPRLAAAAVAQLAEPARNAPMPDRIVGLLSEPERVELAEVAKSILEHDRARLAGVLRLERASDTGLQLLTEPERAAARLHADRQAEREHVARLAEEVRASVDRLDAIAKTPAPTGPGAPHLRGF